MKSLFVLFIFLVTACEREPARVVHDTVYVPVKDSVAAKPALAINPCDRPRPYKKWSNEELNIAQVEYMGTPQSMELIREAGCRTR